MMTPNVWIGLGLGIVIGLLLGLLGAALLFLRRLRKIQAPISPTELKQLRAERDSLRVERDGARADADQLRTDAAALRMKQTNETIAHQALEKELALIKPMLSRASSEKDQLLMEVISLRAENEKLKSEAQPQQPE